METGLRNEGVLEDGYDWHVRWLDLSPGSLTEPGFVSIFAAWKGNVIKYHAERFAGVGAAALRLPNLE